MNPHDEKLLEVAITRELRGLPDLRAPSSLATRVMAAIEQRSAVAWYRRDWQTWPVALQSVSMVVLLSAFGGLCYLGWEFVRTPDFAAAAGQADGLFASLGVLWNVAGALKSAFLLAVKSLNPAFIIGCGVALTLGYAMCLGLGTLYVRLGLARR